MFNHLDDEDERDPFAMFGEAEPQIDESGMDAIADENERFEDEALRAEAEAAPTKQAKVKDGFSWAGFAGGVAALTWIGAAIGGPASYFGVDAIMAMDPMMQAGLIALAFGPALLFWVSASAAGEALKARKLAAELTRIAHEARLPIETSEADAQRLASTVKTEIESLNDAVTAALDRLSELEGAAQRNAALFGEAVAASRASAEDMSQALEQERNALVSLSGDLKGQTDTMAQTINRQVRLMREASKLVKTEIGAAEEALENHLSSFSASATMLGEHTAQFHAAARDAAHAAASLNSSMGDMLDGLSQATRLTETAKQASAEAVFAANETASAVRETTRAAVTEAKRAAQFIRAESQAMQDAAAGTLAKLQAAADAARAASEESQAAADRHAQSIEKRLSALAATANVKKAAPAAPQRAPERAAAPAIVREQKVEQKVETAAEVTSLHAAAQAAAARTVTVTARVANAPQRRVFKGFTSWSNFIAHRDEAPAAANEQSLELASFGANEGFDVDAALKADAMDVVANAGVDLDEVLDSADLERIARCSREGASARRRAVIDAAPGAVTRIARHVKRNSGAQSIATRFRARPDLAKSDKKGEGKELVRAYLLIDAALA
jgi:antitoxin component of RelBE/YafQ-DinJ toxin-antitoxin module